MLSSPWFLFEFHHFSACISKNTLNILFNSLALFSHFLSCHLLLPDVCYIYLTLIGR
uniref:Uncharacterized protein n=1 Tax=Rhizophora mucronata TaxID=61149 RepID=A0A2P2PIE5_RHIMU